MSERILAVWVSLALVAGIAVVGIALLGPEGSYRVSSEETKKVTLPNCIYSVQAGSVDAFYEQEVDIFQGSRHGRLKFGYFSDGCRDFDEFLRLGGNRGTIAIVFCMPSGDYIVRNHWIFSKASDCRDPSDRSRVFFSTFEIGAERAESYNTPAFQAENAERYRACVVKSENGPVLRDHDFEDCSLITYYAIGSGDYDWIGHCSSDDRAYPGCQIDLFWPDRSLAAHLDIGKVEFESFPDVVDLGFEIIWGQDF